MFFKAKDLMTLGNIGGGLACIMVSMEGMAARTVDEAGTYVFWAAVALIAAFWFDFFDGRVARWLGKANRFGAELDNVADLVAYSVAPSFLLYLAYRKAVVLPGLEHLPAVQTAVAALVASIPAISGCLRFARFNVRRLELEGYWVGFPRPASALMILAMVNSHLFTSSPIMPWVGVALVVVLGLMGLSLKPWIGHHGRRFSWYLVIILHMVWMTVMISLLLGPIMDVAGYVPIMPLKLPFDWIMIWLGFYLCVQWTDVPKATRMAVRRLTADWNE